MIDTHKALALADLLENAAHAIRELVNASRDFTVIIDIPLQECGFSVRARKALTRLGCITLSDVIKLSQQQLLGVKHCGPTTAMEIAEKMKRLAPHVNPEANP